MLKKRIAAFLCALVCLGSNARSDALSSSVVGILGESVGLSMLEIHWILEASKKGGLFSKYHLLAVGNFIFGFWDIYKRITGQSGDLQKNIEDSGKSKTDSKDENSKYSKEI